MKKISDWFGKNKEVLIATDHGGLNERLPNKKISWRKDKFC